MTWSLFQRAASHPETLALITRTEQLTHAALADRSARVTASLHERGLLSDERTPIGVVARPTLATMELLHALIAFRIPVLLLPPSLPERERQALVVRANARAVLRPDDAPIEHATTRLIPSAKPADPSLPLAIVPTSGSSGTPKLVVLSRGAFLHSARASALNLPLGPLDRWLLCLPPSHVGGFSILTRCLLAGSCVAAFDAGSRGLSQALPELTAFVAEHAVSVLSLVPTLLDAWLTSLPDWRPPPSLRAVLVGGAALSAALLERAQSRGVPVLATYGLTEACSQVTTTRSDTWPRVSGGVVSSGSPLSGVELAIGEASRILVRSEALCSGYVGESSVVDSQGWFHTEDRGFIDDRGELYVLGRATELIVSGGENVDPRRVEAALGEAPFVIAAAVWGVPDPRFGEIVACALVVGSDFHPDSLSAFLRERLARHELPRRLARIQALPLLANGKLDRAALRAELADELEPFDHPRD